MDVMDVMSVKRDGVWFGSVSSGPERYIVKDV